MCRCVRIRVYCNNVAMSDIAEPNIASLMLSKEYCELRAL